MVYGFIYKIEILSNDGTIWNYIGQTTRQLEQREEEHSATLPCDGQTSLARSRTLFPMLPVRTVAHNGITP